MGKQSKLEQIAIEVRNEILTNNTYKSATNSNDQEYGPTHTRAKSDEKTPVHGKGTGIYMDTENGGGQYDIHGVPHVVGSGRIGNVGNNQYNKDNKYDHPDTSGNIGQVRI